MRENIAACSNYGDTSALSVRLSDEQWAIVEAAKSQKSLCVTALAGTGKTTTLLHIAQAMPSRRILYLVFNSAAKRDAEQRFTHVARYMQLQGGRLKILTAHGLAFSRMAERFEDRLRSPRRPEDVWAEHLEQHPALRRANLEMRRRIARSAIDLVKAFAHSSGRDIAELAEPALTDADNADKLIAAGQVLWDQLANDSALPITHDIYLKVWQLENPILEQWDVVLYDEAQDASQAMLAVTARQRHMQQIYVGDPHQQIYEWRGAVNALGSLDLPNMPLTLTRRFGPKIAALANAILEAKGEKLRLKTLDGADGHVYSGSSANVKVILNRTNVGMLGEALLLRSHLKPGEKICIRRRAQDGADGVDKLKREIGAAYDLYQGKRSSHPKFADFESWEDLKIAVSMDDANSDLRQVVDIVSQYRQDVTQVMAFLRDSCTADASQARYIASTIHGFKGEEGEQVLLGGDLRAFSLDDRTSRKPVFKIDEANLAYVAITRAQSALWLGRAEAVLTSSFQHCGVAMPTVVRPVTLSPTSASNRAVVRKSAPPDPMGYGEYQPGTRWKHVAYGPVMIVDVKSQLTTLELEDGRRVALGTAATLPKLSAMA